MKKNITGMRLELPDIWVQKLKIKSAMSGDKKAGARTEVMKAIDAWIKDVELPEDQKKINAGDSRPLHTRSAHAKDV